MESTNLQKLKCKRQRAWVSSATADPQHRNLAESRGVAALIRENVFKAGDKGIPFDLVGEPISSLVGRNANDGSFPSPRIVAFADRISHNLDLMKAWCSHHRVEIAPHAKTTMSQSLVRRQLAAGAWGVTAATAVQARALHAMGAQRIMLANQLVSSAGIEWASGACDDGLELAVFVDSGIGLEALESSAQSCPISVIVEVGAPGGRAGVRGTRDALSLARAAADTRGVTLTGVAGYEGVFMDEGAVDPRAGVREYLRRLGTAFDSIHAEDLFQTDVPILTAGGSACFDDVADILVPTASEAGAQVVIRSGCYLMHDHGLYESTSPLQNSPRWPPFQGAIEVIGQILSRPEPDLALLDVGRRDVSYDSGLPRPLRWQTRSGDRFAAPSHWTVTAIMDHHAYLAVAPDDQLAVGDFVGLGISHPCTTLDRWRLVPEITHDGTVVDVIATDF